jgi:predicted HTH domain antitoxin
MPKKMTEQQSVTVQLPKRLDVSEFEIRMLLAAKLYETGRITSGEGAEMVGLSKRAFIEMLGKYHVSVFGYTLDEEDLSLL